MNPQPQARLVNDLEWICRSSITSKILRRKKKKKKKEYCQPDPLAFFYLPLRSFCLFFFRIGRVRPVGRRRPVLIGRPMEAVDRRLRVLTC